MSSNTGFAALAQTSRDAALALVAREEEHARLTAAVAARDVEIEDLRFMELQASANYQVEYADRVNAQDALREAQAEQTRMVQRASEAVRAVWEDEVRRVVDTAEFDNRQNLRRISRLEAELAATRAELAGARAALEDQFSAGVLDGLARARAAFVSVIAAPGSGTAAVAEAAPVPE